ncbi:unnamed protein product [Pleuronectes platessa]|uniref:Uncharacterized protein n=1 Tax=Pleuronectes platessa TaxID=8262 RepID=A0A9N7U1L6_PLEPL|nr:unnamed protein product [Pleuronectes platessa]
MPGLGWDCVRFGVRVEGCEAEEDDSGPDAHKVAAARLAWKRHVVQGWTERGGGTAALPELCRSPFSSRDTTRRKETPTSLLRVQRSHTKAEKRSRNPTSLPINMRSADTHQPKSTIFAHLLGLPCGLSATKRKRDKQRTVPKTFLPADGDDTRGEIRGEPGGIRSQERPLEPIAGLGKWREGDQLVTMWVNEGRLPLNVNI